MTSWKYNYTVTTSAGERMVISGTRLTFGTGGSVFVWRGDRRIAFFFAPASILETEA